MGTTGDDLWRYLILPSDQTISSSSSGPAVNLSTSASTKVGKKKKADRTMEVEPATLTGELNDVFRIEDYMAAREAERVAQMAVRETTKRMHQQQQQQPPEKPKTSVKNAFLQPVAVGVRSSDHVVALHDKFQKLGIPQPVYKFASRNDLGWTVEVSFPGMDVEELQTGLREEDTFNSKHEAKEAISKRALKLVVALEKEGKIQKAEKVKKRKVGVAAPAQQEVQVEDKEPSQNYVGQLLEFQRATSSPQPVYTDYAVGTRFACLLTLDSHTDNFGSLDSLHISKKAARQEAARQAVEYFKAQNLWPQSYTDVGGIKKKKVQSTTPNIISTFPSSSSSPPGNNGNNTSNTTTSGQTSYAQRVAQLALQLSLSTPEWLFTSSPNPAYKDFHTVSCFFRNGGPHQGPIGEVRNVFGKKKAKEECARLTLEYLEQVKQARLDYGIKMLGGMEGMELVLDGAVGREAEAEAEVVVARRERDVLVGALEVEDEGGDEFEDAMEEIRI